MKDKDESVGIESKKYHVQTYINIDWKIFAKDIERTSSSSQSQDFGGMNKT